MHNGSQPRPFPFQVLHTDGEDGATAEQRQRLLWDEGGAELRMAERNAAKQLHGVLREVNNGQVVQG